MVLLTLFFFTDLYYFPDTGHIITTFVNSVITSDKLPEYSLVTCGSWRRGPPSAAARRANGCAAARSRPAVAQQTPSQGWKGRLPKRNF